MRAGSLLLALIATPSLAQTVGPNIAQRDELVRRFERCVYTASMNRGEANMAAEIGFSACSTEESAIRSWLLLNQVPINIAEARIIALKLRMKQAIVEVERQMTR